MEGGAEGEDEEEEDEISGSSSPQPHSVRVSSARPQVVGVARWKLIAGLLSV